MSTDENRCSSGEAAVVSLPLAAVFSSDRPRRLAHQERMLIERV